MQTTSPARRARPVRILWTRALRTLAALAILLAAGPVSAQLMVSPTRVVLDGTQRAAQLEIINNSNKPRTFRISLVNRRMSESGGFVAVDTAEPGEHFADQMLRYSPRRVSLAPGASQVIRVMAARPNGLAAGEYRSHLLFSEQAPAAKVAGATPEDRKDADEGIGISLTALVGVSIPVIVRSGETAAAVTVANVSVDDSGARGASTLRLELQRSGNRSVYGDVVVSFRPHGGQQRVIAQAAGVAVYVPNALRRVQVPLPISPSKLGAGELTVTYRARPEEGGAILAETMLPLR